MGRKDGQRTKGNTKAASSARSAQLLGDNVGFVGFGTAAESAFVPLLQGTDTDDGVPGDFRLALRKMHKKDVTTKVKALQEFVELAEKAEGEGAATMLAVLPYWPTVYSKLAMDSDRRVRELAHTALAAVVRPVGKSLAPHLKAMCGAWYLGQSDPHTQAAQAAVSAWQAAFPQAKQAGAVSFCQTEILAVITENLTVATAQSLSDPKTTPVEEMEGKYVRVLAMSLSSLTRLLVTITPAVDPKSLDPLLDHQKFWKLAKHKIGNVRQTFFESLVQLGSSHPDCLGSRGKVLVPAVLPNLQENEVLAARAVWTAALQVLTVVPDAWLLCSPHKAVFPGVFKYISSSEGLASCTFPSLLPFLSKITVDVMGDQEKFLDRWFTSYDEALAKVRGSSEMAAVVCSYVECLMFVFSQDCFEQTVKTQLLSSYLIPLLIRSMKEPKLADSGLHHILGQYLEAWDRLAASKPVVANLNRLFWAAVRHEAVTRVEGEEDEDAEQVIMLLSKLKKKKGDVKQELSLCELDSVVTSLWVQMSSQLETGVRVESVCIRLGLLLRHLTVSRPVLTPEGKEEFLQRVLLPLLTTPAYRSAASTLLWAMVRDLPTDQLVSVLELVSRDHPEATYHLLLAAGSESRCTAVSTWLAGEKIAEYTLGLVSRVANEEETCGAMEALRVLMAAGYRMTDELLFGKVVWTVGEILQKNTVSAVTAEQVGRVCLLIHAVEAGNQWQEEEKAIQLLFILFTLDCGQWQAELQGRLGRAWMKGVRSGEGLEKKVSTLIREQLVDGPELDERNLAKCVLIIKRLKEEEQDAFILACMPDLNELKPLGVEATYQAVLSQHQFHMSSPLPDMFTQDSKVSTLSRPCAALFFARLLLSKLDLATPSQEEEDSCVTVSDSERRSLGDKFSLQLAELVLCLAYTSRPGSEDTLTWLGSALSRTMVVLVSHLDRETCSALQHIVRGNSLNKGGLWAWGLAWLVRLHYRTSEWEVRITSLLPRVDSWSDGELATAATVLSLASELGTGGGMISQTLTVEAARLVSLGGLGGSPQAPGLVWLVSHCLGLATAAQVSDMSAEIVSVLDSLPVWRAEYESRLLYSRDLSGAAWSEVTAVAAVSVLLSRAVEKCPEALSSALWDFASCSLVSWTASLEETGAALLVVPGSALLAVGVARLAAALGHKLGPRGHHPALSPSPALLEEADEVEEVLPPRLREEWAEFFSEGVFSTLLRVYVNLPSLPDPALVCPVLQAELGTALVHCPAPLLLSTVLPPLHLPQDVDSPALPDSLTFLYNHLGPLLLSPSRHTQVAASHLMAAVSPDLVAAESDSGEEEEQPLPARLVEVIVRSGAVLETVLQDYRVGELAPEIPAGCATYTATLGFLLAWRVVLAIVQQAEQELRPKYSEFLRARGHLTQLLDHLFRILPTAPSALESSQFSPSLFPNASFSTELVELAGSCWVSVCRHLPVLARVWWQSQDKQATTAVERLTSTIVTPLLWKEETRAITAAPPSDNMSLRLRDSVREVVATYSIDEGSMELVVSLPANHPLGGLTVESGKRVGVDTGQWRRWMLQLTTFLTHQNGTILDGLNLWRKNVDKRFEGVEECYICFYILHGSNHQLPKLGCRTCKKKFHSACLYKWFSTSNNSSCPLCRNLF